MEAAVSLSRSLHHHAHAALPLPAAHHHHHHHQHHGPVPLHLPAHHHHHHCAVAPLSCHCATVAPAENAPSSKAHSQAPPPAAAPLLSLAVDARPRSSSRAATGYAAALADACARAGTLRRAARHARALLLLFVRRPWRRLEEDAAAVAVAVGQLEDLDARVAAVVRMLVAKGKPGMLADALAEFADICDHLLPPPPRARHA